MKMCIKKENINIIENSVVVLVYSVLSTHIYLRGWTLHGYDRYILIFVGNFQIVNDNNKID